MGSPLRNHGRPVDRGGVGHKVAGTHWEWHNDCGAVTSEGMVAHKCLPLAMRIKRAVQGMAGRGRQRMLDGRSACCKSASLNTHLPCGLALIPSGMTPLECSMYTSIVAPTALSLAFRTYAQA